MATYQVFRHHKDNLTLQSLGQTCEDWAEVRNFLRERGRSDTEQMVVMRDGLIYAVERQDGNGFAMILQDRQGTEDLHWYPRD